MEAKGFNIQNIIDQRESIVLIRRYEEIIRTIRYKAKKGRWWKSLKVWKDYVHLPFLKKRWILKMF